MVEWQGLIDLQLLILFKPKTRYDMPNSVAMFFFKIALTAVASTLFESFSQELD